MDRGKLLGHNASQVSKFFEFRDPTIQYNEGVKVMPRRCANTPRRDLTVRSCQVDEYYHQPSLFDAPSTGRAKSKVGRPAKRIEDGRLRCGRCGINKITLEFYKDRSKPLGIKSSCKACDKEQKENYLAKPGSKAKQRAYTAAYQESHAEEIKAYTKKHYWENRERLRREAKERYAENPEHSIDQVKRWQRENPEKAALLWRRRRARRLEAVGSHTEEEWLAVCLQFGDKCLRCGLTNVPLTRDHIVPLSCGGTDFIDNMQPLCKPCNSSKYTSIIDYRPGGEFAKS